jgi:hypothetical protein
LVEHHSRLIYSEILTDELATRVSFIQRATECFAPIGVVVEDVLADNHMSYRPSYDVAATPMRCSSINLQHQASPTWGQNGKIERFNRTLLIEWADHQVFNDNEKRANAVGKCLQRY